MTDSFSIRRVNVEFLRPGPSHNQLLSPYTQYLAVCNDAGAAVVTVPYEQRVFERRLKELRYETGDQNDRLEMLHEIGRDMGRILEAVPGFTGAVTTDQGSTPTLVHLRLTVSAAELALLPFELAEVPVGSTSSAVAIQTRPPVAVTRHIRTVSSEGLGWPDRPRILFVSSDPADVPFEDHRQALLEAVEPFLYPKLDDRDVSKDGRREQYGSMLTILVQPTLVELQRECESVDYTHLHVLTHGDLDLLARETYGIVLRDEAGNPDVVSGERFVSAVTRLGHRPSVVTIASCDSGNVGSVVIPGASFAHAVHKAGVPFVVGSQFPLSKEGSIPLTKRLYNGLLWGEHPLHVLQQVRAELHARFNTTWHDWASVVAYEALPAALDEHLDALRYTQAKRAVDGALERIDIAVGNKHAVVSTDSLDELQAPVDRSVDRLPLGGQFRLECIGLRAGSRKRIAQARFERARLMTAGADELLATQYDLLDHARLGYAEAVRGILVNDSQAVQRKATLDWVLVQYVSLCVVLEQKFERREWETACLAATYYLKHPEAEQRAWAHASLAELWLLRLADSPSDAEREDFAAKALHHANELNDYYLGVDAFPVKSSRRQFDRYASWWGHRLFTQALAAHGIDRRKIWFAEKNGLVAVAEQIVAKLARRMSPPVSGGASAPPAGGGGPKPSPAPPDPAPPGPAGGGTATAPRPEASLRATARPTQAKRDAPFFTIEALPAGHGDCLWIEYGDRTARHRVLIDCGTQASSAALLRRIEALPARERFVELFVLSHIDSDHIGGALPLFKAVKKGLRFGDVWFNGWRHVSGQLGARQGEMFSTAIHDFELPWNVWRDGGTIQTESGALPEHVLPGGMKLTLLSPTPAQLKKLQPIWTRELKRYGLEPGGRVDYSRFLKGTPSTVADAAALQDIDRLADEKFNGDNGAPNGTSIAMLAEFAGASALLAADAHAPVLVDAIDRLLKAGGSGATRLKTDLYKVSHHGSQNNVSTDLIERLECSRYLVSTNGDHFFHPDRQAIARILKYGGTEKELYFNYTSRYNQVWGDPAMEEVRTKYHCAMHYPAAGESGITVKLL